MDKSRQNLLLAIALVVILVANALSDRLSMLPVSGVTDSGSTVTTVVPEDENNDGNNNGGVGTSDTGGTADSWNSNEQNSSTDPWGEDDQGTTTSNEPVSTPTAEVTVTRNGQYTSKEEVALYLHLYGRLPSNYISKTKARDAGWVSTEGNLDEVCPGMSIGGSTYYNEGWDGEELLPETPEGRHWRECDINYHGGYRGAERLVYSDDGLIFYTPDHYKTFEQLY